MLSKKVVIGLAVILVAYLYSRWSADSFEELDAKEQSIIEAWNSSIVEPYVQFKKIALGINCNLDIIVPAINRATDKWRINCNLDIIVPAINRATDKWRINCNLDLIAPAIKLLEALGLKPGQRLDSVALENLEDLTNTFTHYYTKGAAAERTFTNKEIFKQIIDTAARINCNLDLIVPAIKLLEALGLKPGQRLDSVALENLEDLTNTFTHYYTKGAAAERTFTNKEIFKQIIDTAARLENIELHVGGNAALMALKISQLFPQTQVQLVGPIGPGMKDLLPGTISIPQDSLIDLDEVHLIMEYSLEDLWGGVKTPVANRFITSHDESNSKLTLIQQYFKNVELFNPDLVLLSGLHLLETQTLDFVKDKIVEVKKGLSKIPDTVPIHLELASMANTDCVKLVINEIIPNVNSLGLNEQEISFSSHVLNGPHSEEFLHRKGQPEIHKISDMVLWLLKTYGYSKTNNPSSKLTRIHFHSLTYHIVGIIPESWHNSKSSVAAGTRMAGQQACGTKSLTPDDIELRIPQSFKLFTGDQDRHFDENSPVISWIRDGYKFHFSPVLVCKSPVKTVGLGDAISSTGLMYSEFNPNYNKL